MTRQNHVIFYFILLLLLQDGYFFLYYTCSVKNYLPFLGTAVNDHRHTEAFTYECTCQNWIIGQNRPPKSNMRFFSRKVEENLISLIQTTRFKYVKFFSYFHIWKIYLNHLLKTLILYMKY